ncbi:MAG TPA: hypothetical protein VF250_08195 [Conexibacter sp.]
MTLPRLSLLLANPDGPQLLSLHDGNLWLGAGLVLLLAAVGGLLAHGAGMRLVRTHD